MKQNLSIIIRLLIMISVCFPQLLLNNNLENTDKAKHIFDTNIPHFNKTSHSSQSSADSANVVSIKSVNSLRNSTERELTITTAILFGALVYGTVDAVKYSYHNWGWANWDADECAGEFTGGALKGAAHVAVAIFGAGYLKSFWNFGGGDIYNLVADKIGELAGEHVFEPVFNGIQSMWNATWYNIQQGFDDNYNSINDSFSFFEDLEDEHGNVWAPDYAEIWVNFGIDPPEGLNISGNLSNMDYVENGYWYMYDYDDSRLELSFNIDDLSQGMILSLNHQSVGYGPIDITINGQYLVDNFTAHCYSNSFVGTEWQVIEYLHLGNNTMKIIFGDNPQNIYRIANLTLIPGATDDPLPEILSGYPEYDNTITIDDWAEIKVKVKNNSYAAKDGGIVISFPYMVDESDKDNVYCITSETDSDLEYKEWANGDVGVWYRDTGSGPFQFNSNYLKVEAYEYGSGYPWLENETNTLTIKVKPQVTGQFIFYVRSAMARYIGNNAQFYFNDPYSSTGYIDQQGWEVDRYVINVQSSDTEPPNTTITSGPEGWIDYNDVSFTSTGSDNQTLVNDLEYKYKLDSGSWSGWTSSTDKSYNNLSNGSYTFYVKAKDEAGNEDNSPDSRSFSIDTVDPLIPYFSTGPQPEGGWSTDNSPYFEWTSSSDNGSSLKKYLVEIDDDTPNDTPDDGNLVRHQQYSNVANGTHICYVRSEDNAGNKSDVDSWVFKIDTSPPLVYITYPENNSYFSTDDITEIVWEGNDGNGSGINYYQSKIDNSSWQNEGSNTSKEVENLSEGIHTFSVKAIDYVNYTSEIKEVEFTIDLTPPQLGSISWVDSTTHQTDSITFSLNDTLTLEWDSFEDDISGIEQFELNIITEVDTLIIFNESISGLEINSNRTFSGLANHTTYFYQFNAIDSAGNVSEDIQPQFVTIDTIALPPAIDSLSTHLDSVWTNTDEVGLVFKPLDPSGIHLYYYKWYEDTIWDSTFSEYADFIELSDGKHTLQIKNMDATEVWVSDSIEHHIWIDTTPPNQPEISELSIDTLDNSFEISVSLSESVELSSETTSGFEKYYYTFVKDFPLARSITIDSTWSETTDTTIVSTIESEGIWEFMVAGSDVAQNYSGITYRTLPVDFGPPNSPDSLGYTVEITSATLTWRKNTEGDIIKYHIYQKLLSSSGDYDWIEIGTRPYQVINFIVEDLPGPSMYYYSIRAEDLFTNMSDFSETINVWYEAPSPNAKFQITYSENFPLEISFEDKSDSAAVNLAFWNWDFGDSTTSIEQHPTHQYLQNGVYTVTLKVIDEWGMSDDTSTTITLLPEFVLPSSPMLLEAFVNEPTSQELIIQNIGYGYLQWGYSVDGQLPDEFEISCGIENLSRSEGYSLALPQLMIENEVDTIIVPIYLSTVDTLKRLEFTIVDTPNELIGDTVNTAIQGLIITYEDNFGKLDVIIESDLTHMIHPGENMPICEVLFQVNDSLSNTSIDLNLIDVSLIKIDGAEVEPVSVTSGIIYYRSLYTLNPRSEEICEITYTPIDTYDDTAEISFFIDDIDSVDLVFTIVGVGIAPPPNPFSLLSPPDGREFDRPCGEVITFEWESSIDTNNHEIKYDLHLGGQNQSGELLFSIFEEGIQGTSFTFSDISNLELDSTYYWKVTANNDWSSIECEEIFNFHISDKVNCPLNNARLILFPSEFEINTIYPNPFNPVTNIQFSTPEASNVYIHIYDLSGREVALLGDSYYPPGYHEVQWQANDFSSGIYFVHLTASSSRGDVLFNISKKVMLLK